MEIIMKKKKKDGSITKNKDGQRKEGKMKQRQT
jgi:hypothetical protein